MKHWLKFLRYSHKKAYPTILYWSGTAVSDAVTRPVLTLSISGEKTGEKRRPEAGEALLMLGNAGESGAGLLTYLAEEPLKTRFPESYLKEARTVFSRLSLSREAEILKKKLRDRQSDEHFATERTKEKLPYLAAGSRKSMIKRAPGVDLTLQKNKAVNIDLACRTFNHLVIHPGQTFSFWKSVGKTTRKKGYLDGRIIQDGKLIPGLGGGLCNLANTLHLLVLQTPLTVTELHTHSDALAPDEGPRKPFANGTSISYNNIDFRFRNDTDQDFQIVIGCRGEDLCAQLRCEHPYPYTYRLAEEDHHFSKEGDTWYRTSKIYHETYDKETGELLNRRLILDNHSEVMFDPVLIPQELIR